MSLNARRLSASDVAANSSAPLRTNGVVTDVLAFTVVNVPAAAPLAPITVLLMLPPPMATLLLRSWPVAPSMMTRTRLPVTKRRSTGVISSTVPRKLVFGSGAAPSAPLLSVALLPVRVQPELAVNGSIQRSRPPPSVASTLPLAPSLEGSVQTRLAPTTSGALKPT